MHLRLTSFCANSQSAAPLCYYISWGCTTGAVLHFVVIRIWWPWCCSTCCVVCLASEWCSIEFSDCSRRLVWFDVKAFPARSLFWSGKNFFFTSLVYVTFSVNLTYIRQRSSLHYTSQVDCSNCLLHWWSIRENYCWFTILMFTVFLQLCENMASSAWRLVFGYCSQKVCL